MEEHIKTLCATHTTAQLQCLYLDLTGLASGDKNKKRLAHKVADLMQQKARQKAERNKAALVDRLFSEETNPPAGTKVCRICGQRYKPGQHKCCARCSLTANGSDAITEAFGWRNVKGNKTPQSYCKPCQKGWGK